MDDHETIYRFKTLSLSGQIRPSLPTPQKGILLRLTLPLMLASALILGACAAPPSFNIDPTQPVLTPTPKPKRQNVRSNAMPLRTDAPNQILVSNRSSDATMQCLETQIKTTFRLPDAFVGHRTYDHQAYSVGLINPITKKMGITLDVTRITSETSNIKLYANGAELSRAWQNLPKKCQ